MANEYYKNLKDAIKQVIKPNDNQEITGKVLQNILLNIVNTIGNAGIVFKGVINSASTPEVSENPIFYINEISRSAQTFSNFGGLKTEKNELAIFMKDSNGAWTKLHIGHMHVQPEVTTSDIAAAAVVSTKLANGAVTSAKIDNSAVDETKIKDGSVTLNKLARTVRSSIADIPYIDKRTLSTNFNIGYFECNTEANDASKVIYNIESWPNPAFPELRLGGTIRIRMKYATTANNTRLSICDYETEKELFKWHIFYKGQLAGPNNTWADKEVIEGYWDNHFGILYAKPWNKQIETNDIKDKSVTESKVDDELMSKINATSGMGISGIYNIANSSTAVTMSAISAGLANGTIKLYLVGDSSGRLPSSESRVTAASAVAKLFGKDSLGASVGDIIIIAKLNYMPVYRILPLNDAKAASGNFPGADGIETIWDKTQINKIPGLESAVNAAKNNLPTYSESNMNNALWTGFYPWCTLGRPDGSTGAYTLLTLASTTKDSAGYTTIEQTAYGRQGDELGKIFKRIIFKKDTEVQFGDWLEITNATAVKKLVVETETIADDNSAFTFRITNSIAERMIDIQGIVPCKIVAKQDGSTLNTANFPLNSLTYRIERYVGTDTSNLKITIKIDRDVIYDNRSCTAVIRSSPSIIISYI